MSQEEIWDLGLMLGMGALALAGLVAVHWVLG